MPSHADQWAHDHVFLGAQHERNERRTWFVVALTLAMMIGEIVAGSLFGSMALLADGWHMGTHAAALGIAGLAYLFARRYARNPQFTFGTGKFGELAAFSSAIILLLIAIQIAYESVLRLINPVPIAYGEAVAVAALGLVVNLASAWLLADSHDHHHHGHGHEHVHRHEHHDDDDDHDHHHHHHHHGHHHDNNLRAAYVHVLADAATSVLAIAALLVGMYSGWAWADAVVGVIGSAVIASWAYGLIRDAGAVLLDVNADRRLEATIRARLEAGGDHVTDLHLWQLGPGHRGVVVSLVSDNPLAPATYKQRLRDLTTLSHVTVEVEHGLRR
ncbi:MULTISPECIES: CDF family Co(II)/Ni(II) efflux transporter DmeF [unclassified Bradyrhizobium]|uniref:CDF family Co(II)/Ni(II) efflux transporter DmeF n=1 Tax=unclassified Bradyrhizobium TaxID=2631580 RepID=UPI0028EEA711|nr:MULTISPECIES: CDF family Co(II)/Ni(II) efflux transporter DmeF [unclassified Bradyrhizobium]